MPFAPWIAWGFNTLANRATLNSFGMFSACWFSGLANEGIAPIILYPYHWYVIVDIHAAILIPQQILNGQPTNTLQEGALALPNVDCGVERFADILNQIRTNDCVGTSQHIQFNLQTSA